MSPLMLFTVDVASAGLAAWDSSGSLPDGLPLLVLLSLSLFLSHTASLNVSELHLIHFSQLLL